MWETEHNNEGDGLSVKHKYPQTVYYTKRRKIRNHKVANHTEQQLELT